MTSLPVCDRDDPDPLGALLEHTAGGDQDAFALLYARTVGSVSRLVDRLVQDSAQAEEVVQEVFLEAWLTAARYSTTRGTALPWLHTIARRRAIDRVRASQASRNRDHRAGHQYETLPYDDVADRIDAHANATHLHQLIGHLTGPDRELITLIHLAGHSHKHVAALHGIPIGTVKSRLHQAMTNLRRLANTV